MEQESKPEMENNDSMMSEGSTSQPKMASTDSGLDENIAAALCYIFIVGLIFIFTEKKNKFVRFHAFQAVLLAVAWFVISTVLGIIPVIGWIILPFASLGFLGVWVYTIYKAYQGEKFMLPMIGEIAAKQADNMVA
ncbi:DUF4870 domain-containing protein [Candidatus Dojkabacteria bacterium]|uniref:DUF4870 domain-containing protein n=1 Tax=Candidatus Dojkabacteria bacterium TaxID=2099670 RepID=A0A955RHJ0_9BACT|nr:DUF4870 domain-containing protein [Candidatus Dojkabacteria bacterium]